MEPTDTQPVLVAHLQQIYDVLDASYSLSASLDVQRGAQNVSQARPSRLSQQLQTMMGRVEGYLTEKAEPVSGEVEEV